MYGSTMGKLQLDKVNADGKRSTLFSEDGDQGNNWLEKQITLSSQSDDYHVSRNCL